MAIMTPLERHPLEGLPAKILAVDDEQDFGELLVTWLKGAGHQAELCLSAEAALALLASRSFDVVIADVHLRDMSGLELCRNVLELAPQSPFIVMTAFGSVETAIGAIRAGAYDFLTKPIERQQLLVAVDRALERHRLGQEVARLRCRLDQSGRFEGMLGESHAMRKVFDLVERVADADVPVLLCGESGTGKELVARALHQRSQRHAEPFVAINCAAIPASLLESELFGHVQGAFTDAKHPRPGLVLEAGRGTLLFDEIGEMAPEMQIKLLRALQERRIRPVGGDSELPFEARIVAATNRDLEEAIEQGRFRQDLYYRINVVRVNVPPLRSRDNDVLLLAEAFLTRAAGRTNAPARSLSPPVVQRLREYDWPGNVRELENCIESAVALSKSETLSLEDLPERIRRFRAQDFTVQVADPATLPSLAEMEQRYILKVLATLEGNKSAAARVLGLDRRTLYRKLQSFAGGGDQDAARSGDQTLPS